MKCFTLGLLAQLPGPFLSHTAFFHLPLLSIFLSRVESLVLLKPRWWGGGHPWASSPSPLCVLRLALQVGHVSGAADTPDSCQHLQLILVNFSSPKCVCRWGSLSVFIMYRAETGKTDPERTGKGAGSHSKRGSFSGQGDTRRG